LRVEGSAPVVISMHPFVQLQFLPKRSARFDRVRLEADAHLADFEQPGVVVPGVGLADVEMEVAVAVIQALSAMSPFPSGIEPW